MYGVPIFNKSSSVTYEAPILGQAKTEPERMLQTDICAGSGLIQL